MASEATKQIDADTLWGGGRSPFSISYGKMMMWFFLISDALTFGGLLSAVGFFKHKYQHIWPTSEEVFHAFPGFEGTHLPLMYVALMTFILIVSSVTMVLAVEAGHRMDQKSTVKWMVLTVIGGIFFLSSQVWEWSHFIHGSELGALKTKDGLIVQWSNAQGEKFEYVDKLTIDESKKEHLKHTVHELHEGELWGQELADKMASFKDEMVAAGVSLRYPSTNENGEYVMIPQSEVSKIIQESSPVFGANLYENEYGVKQYAQFFFFVTGFHGFHVFSGVVINFIIMLGVMKGTYQKRGHYEMVEKTGLYWHFVDLVWVFVFTFFYLL